MRKEDEGPLTNLLQPSTCAFTFHPSPFTLYPSLLAILVLAAHLGAVPQGFSPPPVQSHELRPDELNPAFQLHVDRRLVTSSGGESRDVTKTFVDMTPAELAKAVPELKHLEPAENQDLLPQILQRVGADVEGFFDDFPNTTCTEHVTSVVACAAGGMDTPVEPGSMHYDATYNYLALVQAGVAKGRLREFRTPRQFAPYAQGTDAKGEPVQPNAQHGIVTLGFVAMSVHFRPDLQPDSRFRYLGREAMEKEDTYVVAFAQRPTVARQVSSVQFLGRSGMVFMQGVAWIGPASFRILRLRTDIQQPEVNVRLLKETTQILYSAVSFKQGGKTLWLPHEVTVTGLLDKYGFHNQHRYSDYRLFNVEVQQKQDKP